MPRKVRGAPPEGDAPLVRAKEPGCPPGGAASANDRSSGRVSLVPGEKRHGICPGICGAAFDARWTGNDFQVGSFSTRCPRGGECLRSLAEAAGTSAAEIKDDAFTHLAPWLSPDERNRYARRTNAETLPAEEVLTEWHERLLTDRSLRHARDHLWRALGLTPDTLRRYQVGYGEFHGRPAAFMQPVRDGRVELVQLIESFWPHLWVDAHGTERKARVQAIPGSSCLYPMQALRRGRGPLGLLIVSEGRWKALALNQHGFRAVTSITGTNWNDSWTHYLAGRCVAVLYDVDAENIARHRAEEFRAAGIDAWPVLLSPAGFAGKEGVDDALRRGWTADDLRRHIDRCRGWYRRAVRT
jgi:hypothetical protein